ncbi:hypothetical protein [Hyalangium minutum]|uniref:Uncharacterized protein n=1 Tax=Hyalangium minutum TaxID=394096 RepID=A0A085W4V9_9BACT|nr:hypothetical protein [Hyalangium minutum]KFE62722.1 hypothetical protein DB31_3836 [Hyalangium minutum]
MNSLVLRLVCGLLFAALVLGMVVHPPTNFSQGLGMLLPGAFLLSVALKGPRRSLVPKKRGPATPPSAAEPPQP